MPTSNDGLHRWKEREQLTHRPLQRHVRFDTRPCIYLVAASIAPKADFKIRVPDLRNLREAAAAATFVIPVRAISHFTVYATLHPSLPLPLPPSRPSVASNPYGFFSDATRVGKVNLFPFTLPLSLLLGRGGGGEEKGRVNSRHDVEFSKRRRLIETTFDVQVTWNGTLNAGNPVCSKVRTSTRSSAP